MAKPFPSRPQALRVADLRQNTATAFDIRPKPDALEALAAHLDLLGLRKLSFVGEIAAQGDADWRLTGRLGATVVQTCGVTLAPVTTRIDTDVARTYVADLPDVTAAEIDMPEDDNIEALSQWIDPEEVMTEALVLALPLYPRSDGAEAGSQVFAEPGVEPMRDEDARPFAGLAALKAQMDRPSDD